MTHSFKLLGTLEITENGLLSPLMESARGCALLAYLIVTNQSQTRTHVANLFWTETSTRAALRNLRKVIHITRRHAPELNVTRQTVGFQLQTTTTIDYQLVRAALDQESVQQLAEGLQHYRGDLLDTFYLEDAPAFNEWLTIAREQLRGEVAAAYHRLCISYYEAQTWKAGLDAARRWLALDDLDEEAQRWLIKFLAASGQLATAQQQYEASRSRLWEELAVEPEAATQALIAQLDQLAVKQKAPLLQSPVWKPDPLPAPDQLPAVGSLPPQSLLPYRRNNDFAGRVDDLVWLGQRLLPWESTLPQPPSTSSGQALPKGGEACFPPLEGTKGGRSVAITGMGGLGKTQLAVEYAYRYGRFYAGGVYWLSFTQAENVAEEVAATGGEQGMKLFQATDGLTLADQVGRVQQAWQDEIPRLLIFDNCEDEQLLEKWLPVTGGCRILLTSRRSEWARELNVTVRPLATLPRPDSLTLIQQLSPRTAIAPDALDQIAASLGDLPLALHLAGSFLQRQQHITPVSYLQQLERIDLLQHPSLQEHDSSDSPTYYERNVARTFDLSFGQLQLDDETDLVAKQLLAHIVCFAPGEPLPVSILLAAMTSDPDDLMRDLLVDDGLKRLIKLGIVQNTDSQNITAHRLLALFTLNVIGNIESARLNVEAILVQALTEHKKQDPYLHYLPITLSHFVHMTEAAIERQDASAATLSGLLGEHFLSAGNYSQADDWLKTALQLNEALFPAESLAVALSHLNLGHLYFHTGEYKTARTFAQQAAATIQKTEGENSPHLADSYILAGKLDTFLQAYEQAKIYLDKALAIYDLHQEPSLEKVAECHANLWRLQMLQGEPEAALVGAQRTLQIREQYFGEEHREIAYSLNHVGISYFSLGHFDKGKPYLERATKMIQKLLGENHAETSDFVANLGVAEWRLGDFDAAYRYFHEALRIHEQHLEPNHPNLAYSLNNVAEVLCLLGRYEQAQAYHERALSIRMATFGEEHYETMRSLSMVGEVHLRRGALTQAQTTLERALAVQERVESSPQAVSDTLVLLGETYLEQSTLAQAEPVLQRALTIREEAYGRENSETAVALFQLGRWYEAMGEVEVARRHYEEALATLEKEVVATHPILGRVRQRIKDLG